MVNYLTIPNSKRSLLVVTTVLTVIDENKTVSTLHFIQRLNVSQCKEFCKTHNVKYIESEHQRVKLEIDDNILVNSIIPVEENSNVI